MKDWKIPTIKLFAIQVRIKTSAREYWDWCKENWWDGEGQITVFSSIKTAEYQKRQLEKRFYKDPTFKEFRIIRLKFKKNKKINFKNNEMSHDELLQDEMNEKRLGHPRGVID